MTVVVRPGDPDGTARPAGRRPVPVEVAAPPAADGLEAVYGGETTRGPASRVLDIARDVYQDGLDLARTCAEQAREQLDRLSDAARPDEIELQLAIKLDASLGAVLASSGAEAQLQVTFRWQPGGDR
ncbi:MULTISPECIES: CU044_2847 family protein [Streptomyces]|uniref:Trypsin-co-occurring domain-containing protein n=1 Tax=Streptomyces olivaceiscleroticus TaxID=68245 RepID=A0ABP3JML3_9ACTN|nr:CU044_2847 family protein [Streptomyces niger]